MYIVFSGSIQCTYRCIKAKIKHHTQKQMEAVSGVEVHSFASSFVHSFIYSFIHPLIRCVQFDITAQNDTVCLAFGLHAYIHVCVYVCVCIICNICVSVVPFCLLLPRIQSPALWSSWVAEETFFFYYIYQEAASIIQEQQKKKQKQRE